MSKFAKRDPTSTWAISDSHGPLFCLHLAQPGILMSTFAGRLKGVNKWRYQERLHGQGKIFSGSCPGRGMASASVVGEKNGCCLKQKELTSPTEGAGQPAAVPTSTATWGYSCTVRGMYVEMTATTTHPSEAPPPQFSLELKKISHWHFRRAQLEKPRLGGMTDSSSNKLLLLSKPQFRVPNGNQIHRIVVKNK